MTESVSEKYLKEALKHLKSINKVELEALNGREKAQFIAEMDKMKVLLDKFQAKIG